MSDVLAREKWIERVLGLSFGRPTPNTTKQVRFAPVPTEIPPPNGNGVVIGTRPRSGAVIKPPPKLQPQTFTGEDGKTLKVVKTQDGKILFTSPPPPVKEITFSGGGAKGGALPGAIQALQDGGVLKQATKIAGASVGSMTAALVAAGITAEEFTRVANADATTDKIAEGKGDKKAALLLGTVGSKLFKTDNPLTGQGLEDVVREVLDDTLRSRIVEYLKAERKDGREPDQTVVDTAKKISEAKTGATFMDMRVLSKTIPAIKEVVITGTYTTEFEQNNKGEWSKVKDGNTEGQLYVFDADSEPNLPVAVAVHASASFPGTFKPVDIVLSMGYKVRFIDGGVMNNTPTSSSIGNERNLDPMPPSRGMTFVFEDSDGVSDNLVKGLVTPSQGTGAKIKDWFVGSNHVGAEYAKDRDLTDRPEEIVVVPLQLTLPPKKPGGKGRKIDMRDGTLNFALSLDDKIELQKATKGATKSQIDRESEDKTREFASDSQMFVSVPLSDLKTLADNDYPGANEARVFRERVAEMIGKLHEAVDKSPRSADALQDKNATMALDELDRLAGDDVDFQGYVGRELNKGGLDGLLEAIRKDGRGSDVMTATFVVSDALKAHTYADNVLKQLVYPKMKGEPKGGAGIETLLIVEGLLRAAKTPEDVNEALKIAIDHFKTKPDKKRRGHKKFADNLARRLMPVGR